MENNLVIVESPAKANTIEKFLGKDYLVRSCFGHIRDLSKKNLGIEINNNYEPQYEVPADKTKIVTELKKLTKAAQTVWLASDEDREGEAIAWHLFEVLKLKTAQTKRIVFHEITRDAIQQAIKNPRSIDQNLVNAQQARRILDRLVGFELSPVLWKKIKSALSAGRVQSVAVRLIVEREREIIAFKSIFSYKITAIFNVRDINEPEKIAIVEFKAELPKNLNTKEQTLKFLNKCKTAEFEITDIVTQPTRKSPAPPFTTSSLQQEASRKFGFSVSQTMSIAQKLYEAGKITYMRTDSVNLSDTAIASATKEITKEFGKEYVKIRKFKTKTKGAQEAHEAIRPTYINNHSIIGNNAEKKLYELIWKRTIASQMSDAELEKTTATISISTCDENFIATGEVIKFDGFLKVYFESTDDEKEHREFPTKGLLPPLKVHDKLYFSIISATQRFTHHPPRFTEANLVRKLEELGIGRPSTYAPIISTIQKRGYVIKEDRQGIERKYDFISLINNTISEEIKTEITGAEKSKLFPTDIGIVVNDFLVKHFDDILDYNFTATVEKEFDEIAAGELSWNKMIDKFYKPFHKKVENTIEFSEPQKGERILGEDPETKKTVSVRIGKYGPMAQLGKSNIDNPNAEKPKFASLLKHQHLETITLEEALNLFKLPRLVGKYEAHDVTVAIGRFGPYAKHKSSFYSLKKDIDDPFTIELERVIELIEEKREKNKKKIIKTFEENLDLTILNGHWGPYISYKKKNFKIPKDKKPESLSLQDCMKLIEESKKTKSRYKR